MATFRHTWESLGTANPPVERPYLTELGPEGVHLAWVAAMQNLRLVDPRVAIPRLQVISESTFVTHLGYLLAGIASSTFPYDKREFRLSPGTCFPGVTTDALASICGDFLACGLICRRLEAMCEEDCDRRGLVYRAFVDGVEKYLQGYRWSYYYYYYTFSRTTTYVYYYYTTE